MESTSAYEGLRGGRRELEISRVLGEGAAWGVPYWLAYAVLEYLLYSVVSLYSRPDTRITPASWQAQALLLDCYWALGIIGGAVGATVAAIWSRGGTGEVEEGRAGATLSLLVGMLANLAMGLRPGRSEVVVATIALTLIGVILWALRNPDGRLARWGEIHPLIVALLLLGPTWLGTEALDLYSRTTKALAELLLVAAILGIHLAVQRTPRRGAGVHFAAGMATLAVMVLMAAERSGAHYALPNATFTTAPNPQRPPVVLVSLDTTRADHLSLYGYPVKTAPNLEQFASEATLYTDVTSASDHTLSSHGSIFTGVYPSWHGAHAYDTKPRYRGLDAKLPTLAGMLSAQGYLTAGVAANTAFLLSTWGLNRGFGVFQVPSRLETPSSYRVNLGYGASRLLRLGMPDLDFDSIYLHGDEVNRETWRIMDRYFARDRSIFLFVNYMDAHWPYLAPARFQAAYGVRTAPLDPYQQNATLHEAALGHGRSFADLTQLVSQYDAGIASEDDAFGQLMQRLKDMELYDQALIIVTADHGETFGERGLTQHGVSVYADQTRVPLVIKYPHQKTAKVVGTSVSHVDILPTVMDTLGYPVPPHVQGRSLRDLSNMADRPLISESFANEHNGGLGIERALRAGTMKLVASTTGRHELYDLAKDPRELQDLGALDSSRAAVLETSLRQWLGSIPKQAAQKLTVQSEEEMRRLKSLGYVQ